MNIKMPDSEDQLAVDRAMACLKADPEGTDPLLMKHLEDGLQQRRKGFDSGAVQNTYLKDFDIPHEAQVISAHRMPDQMFDYAKSARARGLRAIIAGAGGAAHLPGMLASQTIVPVLGFPVPSKYLRGEDSLLSIVQMP